jgi:aromatic-L-amino-acid decarboxylase
VPGPPLLCAPYARAMDPASVTGPVPHMTRDEFRRAGHALIDWIADYWDRVADLPVLSRVQPGDILASLPEAAPEDPEPWEAIAADVDRLIMPGITHWQSPNFFAFFPANASPPAVLGELLSAGLGVNGMLWATSPAATELETRMLDWMARLLGLPERFLSTSPGGGGVIQGTASESTLVAMLAARRRALQRDPAARLVAYTSTQAHSSVIKAAMIAGLARDSDDREHLRLIDVDDSFAMRPDLLRDAMRRDRAAGLTPFYVCATVGTTSSTAVDPLEAIGPLCAEFAGEAGKVWLHVDAAHAGAACICPEFRWMLRGVEHADSLCFNPHKWLLTNFDCDLFWTADRAALTGALSITPEYLRNAASERGATDYRDWQVPLGRRFRALKLWFVLRRYGAAGLRAHVREHVRLAALFEDLVRTEGANLFEIAAPRTINLVCFRLRGDGPAADDRNRALLDRINATGRAYLTHTALPAPGGGRPRVVLRLCVGSTWTAEEHVRAAWRLIRDEAARLPS